MKNFMLKLMKELIFFKKNYVFLILLCNKLENYIYDLDNIFNYLIFVL